MSCFEGVSEGRDASIAVRTAVARTRGWLSVRHSLRVETAVVLALYAAYEASRGVVVQDARVAIEHARAVVGLERSLGAFAEGAVQDAAHAVPGLVGALSLSYLTLHLTVTAGLLVWLHRRRPAAFPLVRTTLLVASALALVGYLAFPTAPPRLAGLGISDTVSGGHVDLNEGLVSALYNPYAAVPSMHAGYALIVGVSLLRFGRRPSVRLAGLLYPAFVLLVIVATGNHFFFDAAVGAALAALAFVLAAAINGKYNRQWAV
jgi:hypothetical protein